MPEPRGLGFTMCAKVNADHASDTITRRSRTGFLVYLNSAPIYWWSKKQNSVESSSFGSKFIAMKQCCEYIRGPRYKLRMIGISLNSHIPLWRQPVSVGQHYHPQLYVEKRNPKASPTIFSEKELHGTNGKQHTSIPMTIRQTY